MKTTSNALEAENTRLAAAQQQAAIDAEVARRVAEKLAGQQGG